MKNLLKKWINGIIKIRKVLFMAESKLPFVSLELDKPRIARFPTRSIIRMENDILVKKFLDPANPNPIHGLKLGKLRKLLIEEEVGRTEDVLLLWTACIEEDPELTPDNVMDIYDSLDSEKRNETLAAIGRMFLEQVLGLDVQQLEEDAKNRAAELEKAVKEQARKRGKEKRESTEQKNEKSSEV